MLRYFALLALMLCLAAAACADGIVDKLYVGAGGAWLDGNSSAFPADVEAHGGVSSSLSPHLSVIGGLDYGFTHSYFRYQGGARVTATDVENQDFNSFLGLVYRGASKPEITPNEWAPDAGFGWRAFKKEWPRVLLTGEASYGLTSKSVIASLRAVYAFPIKGF